MRVNQERLEKALLAISENLTISSLFQGFGSYSNVVERGDEIVISCPFHLDESPSLGINDKRGKWHCFSCGRGGDAVSAYRELSFSKKGIKIGYSTAVDQLIYMIPAAKSELNFTTVQMKEEQIIAEGFAASRFNKNIAYKKTMNDVYEKMRKNKQTSFQQIAQVVDLMAGGMSPEIIFNMIDKMKLNSNKAIEVDETITASILLNSLEW